MAVPQEPITLGFIPAHRGFFSIELAAKMRQSTLDVMARLGIEAVAPTPEQTKAGCIENREEAQICAELFRDAGVQGIVIGAVNFGDEQAASAAVREAGLDVPVLIFGCQEEEVLSRSTPRRDAFCGLLSIGDALRQIGVPYSIGQRPICFPTDDSFSQDLDWFVRVCRVVNGISGGRYAQIGTRPEGFWTCRYSERELQALGATTVVADLSEAIAGANAIASNDAQVRGILEQIQAYADTSRIAPEALDRMARFEAYLRRFREEHDIDAFAIQCWNSIQRNYGICTCSTMSRLGDDGIPCACEVDVLGAVSMHALQLASGMPAALADWNNLHNEDDELVNVWHCGVFPASFTSRGARLGIQNIMVACGGAPEEKAHGTVQLVADPSPLTLCRVTQDADGAWKAALAQGAIEPNKAETFGGYGWCRIKNLQRLYRDVLLQHFPHHVAITQAHVANALWEAFGNYFGMSVYHATQETPGLYTPRLPF